MTDKKEPKDDQDQKPLKKKPLKMPKFNKGSGAIPAFVIDPSDPKF